LQGGGDGVDEVAERAAHGVAAGWGSGQRDDLEVHVLRHALDQAVGTGERGASTKDKGEGGCVQRGDGCDGADDPEVLGDGRRAG
jgi:hypothetical protein